MSIEPLHIEQASVYYDEAEKIVHVAYRGDLGADVTVQVYDWLDNLIRTIGVENIYAEIFDFREVTAFQEENLQTARKTSKRMNLRLDTSQFPVALLVKTFYQEEILRTPMHIPPEHQRKRIVKTEAEARAFIEEWHQRRREAG